MWIDSCVCFAPTKQFSHGSMSRRSCLHNLMYIISCIMVSLPLFTFTHLFVVFTLCWRLVRTNQMDGFNFSLILVKKFKMIWGRSGLEFRIAADSKQETGRISLDSLTKACAVKSREQWWQTLTASTRSSRELAFHSKYFRAAVAATNLLKSIKLMEISRSGFYKVIVLNEMIMAGNVSSALKCQMSVIWLVRQMIAAAV